MSDQKLNVQKIDDLSDSRIEELYAEGNVLTRIDKGVFQNVISTRIDLDKFELTSENRRILRKTEEQHGRLSIDKLPLPMDSYSWEIGKMAKDFYDQRDATFSANKIKELLTDEQKSSFNTLLRYAQADSQNVLGYAVCLQTPRISHYAYPFYDTSLSKDTGLAMMLSAIELAKNEGKKYIYLGTLQRYKLQFVGFEWFDEDRWSNDINKAKDVLSL